jgi:hypothetical protein
MATKAPVKKTRVTKAQVTAHRANAKKDHSPKWDGVETMTADEFAKAFRTAMTWYRLESSGKELKPRVIDWMARNDYTKAQIQSFKKTKDNRCSPTVGASAASVLKGMPGQRADWNEGRDTVAWLKDAIAKIINEGKDDIDEDDAKAVEVAKPVAYVPTIQERLRDAAGQMTEELDVAIDEWIMNPDAFDPKAFKTVSLLRGKGVKPAHARLVKGFYESMLAEIEEVQVKGCDEQLAEAYEHVSKKNIKKLHDFLIGVMSACDQIIGEAKLNKAPRAKKVVPAEKLVAKLKFKATDDKLGVTSVPPAQLIGAQGAVVYNTKTRKIGVYTSLTSSGLAVKGTSITNFTDKSTQKTLRKPEIQMREFKEQNTNKRVETWFKNIKATEIQLNGRLNADVMILKVFK